MTPRQTAWTSLVVFTIGMPISGCGLHGKPKVERRARQANAPGGAAPTSAAPPSSEAASAELEPEKVVAPGIVEPWGDSVSLSAKESGWIAEIDVREGQAVDAGQLLATLDDAPQRYAVELARAELAEAEAALTRIGRGATAEELRKVQADYEAARARGDLARSTAARTARLQAEKVIPDSEAERAADGARTELALADGAEARVVEVKRGARAEDRSAARARVAAALARVSLAEANQARRRVVAPSAATVLLSRYHAGEFYNVATGPILVLGDMSRLQVRLEVDEIDAQDVSPGATCALYSDGGVRLAEGTVVRLAPKMGRRALPIESPTARADVRVREVFVEVPPTSRLIPGQRVWGHTPRGGTTSHATGAGAEGRQ